ncbi:secreted immunoglobulin domain 1 [Polymixia lowei]
MGPGLALPVEGLSVKVGDDVDLECPLLARLSSAMLSWYQQRAGESPRLVLSYRLSNSSAVKYGSGFHRDKFSVQPDRRSLLLHGSEERDSAVYYCGLSERTHRHTTHR